MSHHSWTNPASVKKENLNLETICLLLVFGFVTAPRKMRLFNYLHVCVQNKVSTGESKSEVVSGQLALLWVECQLVTGEPSFVSNNGWSVDQRSSEINIDISVQTDALMWVSCLEAASFASKFVHKRKLRWRLINDTSITDGGTIRNCQSRWRNERLVNEVVLSDLLSNSLTAPTRWNDFFTRIVVRRIHRSSIWVPWRVGSQRRLRMSMCCLCSTFRRR